MTAQDSTDALNLSVREAHLILCGASLLSVALAGGVVYAVWRTEVLAFVVFFIVALFALCVARAERLIAARTLRASTLRSFRSLPQQEALRRRLLRWRTVREAQSAASSPCLAGRPLRWIIIGLPLSTGAISLLLHWVA